MVEQPNTAAIRAMLWTGLDVETALDLCDALDAARAERDELRKLVNGCACGVSYHYCEAQVEALREAANTPAKYRDDWLAMKARAESAEAELNSAKTLWELFDQEREDAEARIAAALALIRSPHRLLYSEVVVACIESALTEGADR